MNAIELFTLAFLSLPVLAFFWAGCPCCGTCGTVLSDTFDRSDSTDIGSDWTESAGDWAIVSNKLRVTTADAIAICNSAGTAGRQKVSVIVRGDTTGDKIRVICNYVDSDNYDFAEITLAFFGSLALFTRSAGVNTQIGSNRGSLGYSANSDITLVLCSSASMVVVSSVSHKIGGRTTNNGTQVALATGGTVTGNVDFNTFVYEDFDNDTGGCPTCALGCDKCLSSSSATDVEIVISGVGVGTCSDCAAINATYIKINSLCTSASDVTAYLFCLLTGFDGIVTIDVVTEGGINKVRVTIGLTGGGPADDITFVKSYTSDPIDETTNGNGSCYFDNLSLALENNSLICLGSPGGIDATCVITAL